MARSRDVRTPLARLAFADNLFEAREARNGKKQYGCTLLFPKGTELLGRDEDGKPITLQDVALEAAVAEWGEKARNMIRDGLIHNPFLDGDGPQGKSKKTGEPHAGFPGHIFIRCISGEAYPPRLVRKNRQIGATKDEIYSGCYGYAVVNAFTWENIEKGKGLSFSISMFQVAQDGERLGGGGGVDVDKWAEKIEDDSEAPEETKTGKGATGLFE